MVILNDLPIELIAEIFIRCLEKNGFATTEANEAPTNVSHVCKHWRQVSLSAPELWSRIWINPQNRDKSCAAILETWIQRSRNYGFSFIITHWESLDLTMDVLVRHSSIWVNIFVRQETKDIRRLLSVFPHRIPRLKLAHIDGQGPPLPFSTIDLSAAHLIPLTDLSIAFSTLLNTGGTLHSLRFISLSAVPTGHAMEFLSHCPSVEELVVSFAFVWSSESNSQLYGTLIFHQLKTFKLISAHEEYMEPALNSHVAFLDCLHAPKLKSLFLSIGSTTDISHELSLWSAIFRLISRHEAQLENLEMWNNTLALIATIGLLRKVHGLRYLGIEYSLLHRDLIDTVFLPTNGSELLCPHLEAFSILGSRDFSEKQDFDVPYIASAVRSRVDTLDDRPRRQFQLVVCGKLRSSVAKCQPVVGVEIVHRDDWIDKQRGDLFRNSGRVWNQY